ncbi:MAG: hypothetical protein ABI376_04410 [Caulobacteraceae bacterium]
MTPIKIALAAAALAAFAAPVAAEPVFDAFTAVCAAGHADYPAVVEAAENGGWHATTVTGDATMPGVTISDKIALSRKLDGAPLTLLAWRGTKGAIKINACTMRVGKADFPQLQAAARDWLGFVPQDVQPKKVVARFTETPTGHHALIAAEYEGAAAGDGMEILTVSTDAHGAVLDVLKIKK